MKAAFFLGSRRIEIRDVNRPVPGPKEALVRVGVCGMCGSDLYNYARSDKMDIILGHEVTGTIVDVGKGVRNFNEGEKVAVYAVVNCGECYYCERGLTQFCRPMKIVGNGYAEYVKVPERCLLKIPEGITLEEASFALDVIGVPFHGLKRLAPCRGDSVVVYGCGSIGLSTILMLRSRGLERIFAVDLVDSRLKMAKKLGAATTINIQEKEPVETVKQLTEGRGTDLAIDAAGAQAAELSALNSVRMCGKVLFIGTNPTGKLEIDIIQQLMNRDITLIGTFYFAKDEFKEIISFLLREKDELMKIVTHRFPLEKIDEAFRLFEMKKTLRVLIKP